jgi:hypothetical protein
MTNSMFRKRQVAELFVEVPDKDEYPDYYEVIPHVVSLNSIKVDGLS